MIDVCELTLSEAKYLQHFFRIEKRNTIFRLSKTGKHECHNAYVLAFALTCFYLMKGGVTFFRLETIVAKYLASDDVISQSNHQSSFFIYINALLPI